MPGREFLLHSLYCPVFLHNTGPPAQVWESLPSSRSLLLTLKNQEPASTDVPSGQYDGGDFFGKIPSSQRAITSPSFSA